MLYVILYMILAYLTFAWLYGTYMILFDKGTQEDFKLYHTSTPEKLAVFILFPALIVVEIWGRISSHAL